MEEIWKTIDTAPTDGTLFIGFAQNEELDKTGMMIVYKKEYDFFRESLYGNKIHYLTHWMPLPERPNKC